MHLHLIYNFATVVPDIEPVLLASFVIVSSVHLPVFSLPQPYLSMPLEHPSQNRHNPEAEKSRICDMCAVPCNSCINHKVQPALPTSKAAKSVLWISTFHQSLYKLNTNSNTFKKAKHPRVARGSGLNASGNPLAEQWTLQKWSMFLNHLAQLWQLHLNVVGMEDLILLVNYSLRLPRLATPYWSRWQLSAWLQNYIFCVSHTVPDYIVHTQPLW